MIFGFGKKKQQDDDDHDEDLELISFQGPVSGPPPNLNENPGLVRAGLIPAKEIVSDAVSRDASMLRLDPKGAGYIGMLMVDGMKYPGPRLQKQQGTAITQILKMMAGLSIQERKKPQRGSIKADYEGQPYEITIDITPTPEGERLNIYLANLKTRPNQPDEIGISETLKEKIREIAATREGFIGVCGGPRNGLTTSTVGVVRSVDAYVYGVYKVFDTGTWDIPYVTDFEREEGHDLETTITRAQRSEAEVIYVPPITSDEEAKVLIKAAAKSGIIAEYPAKDAVSGLLQLIKWIGDEELVASNVKAIITSKLIRKLCPSCKQAYAPNPKLLAKIGLSKETKALYRHRVQPQELQKGETWDSCPKCHDIGYQGQIAMFELLEMTEGMQEVVRAKPSPDAIRAQVKKDGGLTLQKDGLHLVSNGTTSLEELQRTFKS
ncbi:ATPase, T2SS/T4P/T4SS family [Planctomycetaceae bacterium]|nr:ATPase, T2SS/T4P/T4SS family [Planctomycetaceae bacterium]MDG2391469.1 ATPase, T2SS/T4P/T4SS family [Planctomycetaceae bacterium]